MLRYIKKDLLTVKSPAILVHATNCRGVMGTGIAKEFKAQFPVFFAQYAADCRAYGKKLLGCAGIYGDEEEQMAMGCLFTSDGYGKQVDGIEKVLKNTEIALDNMLTSYLLYPIYSNKFNSGRFGVPWHRTENVLKGVLAKHPKITWTVCSDPSEVKP